LNITAIIGIATQKTYDSDYFNPKKTKNSKRIVGMTIKTRIDLIKEKGYNLEIVWESGFKRGPQINK
jgi:hypothetical protein